MKPDKLEKFVIDNRDGFDDFEPDPAVWAQVQNNIKPVRKISWVKIASRVAAVAVIFITSYVFHDFMSERKQSAILAEQADPEQIEEVNNYFEAQAYYTSMTKVLVEVY